MTRKEKVESAAWERSRTVDRKMRVLTMHFFVHLHGFLGSHSLFGLDDNRLLEWNAVQMLQPTAPALSFVRASLSHEVVQPLHVEQPAAQIFRLIGLDGQENAVRSLPIPGDAGSALNKRRLLVYRVEAPQLGSVHNSSMKKRLPSS